MDQPTLLIIGADNAVGYETARLAVAYGARVVASAPGGRPPATDEPWVEGVVWVADPRDVDEPIDGVVFLCESSEDSGADAIAAGRTVLVNPPHGTAHTTSGDVVVAMPGEVIDEPIESIDDVEPQGAIRVERLGMALLRAALDVDIPPRLDHRDLVELGDAVFIQGASQAGIP